MKNTTMWRSLVLLLSLGFQGLHACPGGSLRACVEVCLDRPKLYGVCSEACEAKCDLTSERRRLASDPRSVGARNQCMTTTVNDLALLATNADEAVTTMRAELNQLSQQISNFHVGYLLDGPAGGGPKRPSWSLLGGKSVNLMDQNVNPNYNNGVDAMGGTCWPQDAATDETDPQSVYIFWLHDDANANDVPNNPASMKNGYFNSRSFYIGNAALEALAFEEVEVCMGSSENCHVRSCFTLGASNIGTASCSSPDGLVGLSDWKKQIGIGIGLCPNGNQSGQMLADTATFNSAKTADGVRWTCNSGTGGNASNGNQYMHVSSCGITYMPDNNTNEFGWYRNPGHVAKESGTVTDPYRTTSVQSGSNNYARAGYHCCDIAGDYGVSHDDTIMDLFFIRGKTWASNGADAFLSHELPKQCGCYL